MTQDRNKSRPGLPTKNK
jgi:hypothetical protein